MFRLGNPKCRENDICLEKFNIYVKPKSAACAPDGRDGTTGAGLTGVRVLAWGNLITDATESDRDVYLR